MAVTTDQMYDVFQSIDASLKALVTHFGALRVPINGHVPASKPAYDVPDIAPDRDLDGKWGNPAIRAKDPRDWTGDSQLGKPMSECPIAYLDLVAERLDYFAGNEPDDKKRKYNLLDASRARGWAKRLREGWQPPPVDEASAFPSDAPMVDDESIPF